MLIPPIVLMRLEPGQCWLARLSAGTTLRVEACSIGAGAALFAWAAHDPFEQLSDAYTFMELRRVRPRVGDLLYSTLRRPIMSVERDDTGESIDLLVHDIYWQRAHYVSMLSPLAKQQSVSAPELQDWPYPANLFAQTRIQSDGSLVTELGTAPAGTVIEVIAKFDVFVGLIVAAQRSSPIEISISDLQENRTLNATSKFP
jgi:uncharacterized protein YcgI (DUF1989 family)